MTLEVIDLNGPEGVQVQVSEDGTKVWVNVDGICRLRSYDCKAVEVEDNRKASSPSLKMRLEGIQKLMEQEDDEIGLSDDGTAAIMLLEGIIKEL